MINSIITCIRRLDPASEYSIGYDHGTWVLWACYGEAAIAEYATQATAEDRLARSKRESRTVRRIFLHNGWRLISWAKNLAWRWTSSSKDLDQIIA